MRKICKIKHLIIIMHITQPLLALAALTPTALAQGKRGLSYNDASWGNYFLNHPQITWAYNWDITPNNLSSAFEFVPMLWGAPSSPVPDFENAATNAKHMLGYNEPDLKSQANVIPSIAARAWKSYVQPLVGKVRIGGPAVTNAGDGVLPYAGLGWLEAFLADCASCQIDFIPVHWYANDTAENFKAYLTQVHERFGKPIWVSEFMLQDSEANQIAFLEDVMSWMDARDWVERYAYFGVFELMLIDGAGTGISKIGQTYATYSK